MRVSEILLSYLVLSLSKARLNEENRQPEAARTDCNSVSIDYVGLGIGMEGKKNLLTGVPLKKWLKGGISAASKCCLNSDVKALSDPAPVAQSALCCHLRSELTGVKTKTRLEGSGMNPWGLPATTERLGKLTGCCLCSTAINHGTHE